MGIMKTWLVQIQETRFTLQVGRISQYWWNSKAVVEDANISIELDTTFAKAHRLKKDALAALERYGQTVKSYQNKLRECRKEMKLQYDLNDTTLYRNNNNLETRQGDKKLVMTYTATDEWGRLLDG